VHRSSLLPRRRELSRLAARILTRKPLTAKPSLPTQSVRTSRNRLAGIEGLREGQALSTFLYK
jgi:hypothetical protein